MIRSGSPSARTSVLPSLHGHYIVACNPSTQLAVASHLGTLGRKLFTLSTVKPMDVYYASYNLARKI